jgi:hypothetical protein
MQRNWLLLSGLLTTALVACPQPQNGTFTISANPQQVYLLPNGAANINVQLKREANFTGTVDVTLKATPGFTAQALKFENGSDQGTLVLRSDNTVQPGNNQTLTLQGSAGETVQTASLNAAVAPYTLSFVPSTLNIVKGGTTKATVITGRVAGFNDAISLNVTGLPNGVTAAPATIKASQSSVDILISAAPTAAVSSAPATITLTSSAGGFNQNLQAELSVVDSPATTELMTSIGDVTHRINQLGLYFTPLGSYSYGSSVTLSPTSPLGLVALGAYGEFNSLISDTNYPTPYLYNPDDVITTQSVGTRVQSKIYSTEDLIGFLPSPQTLKAFGIESATAPRLTTQGGTQTTISKLPSGEYDCTSGTCPTKPAVNDDLIVRWKTLDNKDGVLVFDWDGSSDGAPNAPVKVFQYQYTNSNPNPQPTDPANYLRHTLQPTKLRGTVTIGGIKRLEIKLDAAWQLKPGNTDVYVQLPNSIMLSGFAARADGTKFIEIKSTGWKIEDTKGLSVDVDVSGTLASIPVSAKASIRLNSTISRDENGYPKTLSLIGNGNVDTQATLDDQTVKFAANLSDAKLSAAPRSVRINSGMLQFSDQKTTQQLPFSGVLDDSNTNCVPGENLNFNFASGNTNLETLFYSIATSSYNSNGFKVSCGLTIAPNTPTGLRLTDAKLQTDCCGTPSPISITTNIVWNPIRQAERFEMQLFDGTTNLLASSQGQSFVRCYTSGASAYCTFQPRYDSITSSYINDYFGKTLTMKLTAINSEGASAPATLEFTLPQKQ